MFGHAGFIFQAEGGIAYNIVFAANCILCPEKPGVHFHGVIVPVAIFIAYVTGYLFLLNDSVSAMIGYMLYSTPLQRCAGSAFFIHHADIVQRSITEDLKVLECFVKSGIVLYTFDEFRYVDIGADYYFGKGYHFSKAFIVERILLRRYHQTKGQEKKVYMEDLSMYNNNYEL